MSDVSVGTWRDLYTGVDPMWGDPEWVDGATDQPGTPIEPIATRIEGGSASVLPWYECLEDPTYPGNLPLLQSPEPQIPDESVGARPVPTAYRGEYRSRGPVFQWGHEASGGWQGDQAVGRIQRFPANIPERYDPNGVWNVDYRDELAAMIANNDQPIITDTEVTSNLIQYPNY